MIVRAARNRAKSRMWPLNHRLAMPGLWSQSLDQFFIPGLHKRCCSNTKNSQSALGLVQSDGGNHDIYFGKGFDVIFYYYYYFT